MSPIHSNVRLRGWVRAMLIVCMWAGLAHCSAGTGSGGISTETGNPPVVDRALVHLDGRARGAVIVGEPGAISSASGVVTAVDLRTGEVATAAVEPDGSFEIQVSDDEGVYYVVAGEVSGLGEARMRAASDPASVVTVGSTSVVESAEALGLSCFAEQWAARGAIDAAAAEASRECESDDDCVVLEWRDPCSTNCGLLAAERGAAENFTDLLGDLPDSTCPGVASGDCSTDGFVPQCDATPYEARCERSVCNLWNTEVAVQCGGPAVWLKWSRYPAGGVADTAYEYTGQAYFGLTRTDDVGTRCVTTLTPCIEGSVDTADADMRGAVAALKDVLDDGGITLPAGDAETMLQVDVYIQGEPIRLTFPTCDDCDLAVALRDLSWVLEQVELQHDPCAECLSPMSNLEKVGALGLEGCVCDDAGSQVCADFVPLVCSEERQWTHAPSSDACN